MSTRTPWTSYLRKRSPHVVPTTRRAQWMGRSDGFYLGVLIGVMTVVAVVVVGVAIAWAKTR